jgi:hypothetical protein
VDAQLSRLAAKALQSPLFLQRSQLEDNLAQATTEQLIASGSIEKTDEDLVKFLEDCVNSLDWALRNRVPNWRLSSKLAQTVSGWLENPLKCPDLPIVNRDRFPEVDWEENPRQIGVVEGDRLILLGKEQGTDAEIVSRDNGVVDTYHAAYFYEIIGQNQGKIEVTEDVEATLEPT